MPSSASQTPDDRPRLVVTAHTFPSASATATLVVSPRRGWRPQGRRPAGTAVVGVVADLRARSAVAEQVVEVVAACAALVPPAEVDRSRRQSRDRRTPRGRPAPGRRASPIVATIASRDPPGVERGRALVAPASAAPGRARGGSSRAPPGRSPPAGRAYAAAPSPSSIADGHRRQHLRVQRRERHAASAACSIAGSTSVAPGSLPTAGAVPPPRRAHRARRPSTAPTAYGTSWPPKSIAISCGGPGRRPPSPGTATKKSRQVVSPWTRRSSVAKPPPPSPVNTVSATHEASTIATAASAARPARAQDVGADLGRDGVAGGDRDRQRARMAAAASVSAGRCRCRRCAGPCRAR